MTQVGRKLDLIVAIAVIFSFLALSIADPRPFQALEERVYEAELKLAFRGPRSTPATAIIRVDDKSLTKLGPWPWSGDIMAELLDILNEGQAKVVGIDLPLFHPERNQSLMVIRELLGKLGASLSENRAFDSLRPILEQTQRMAYELDHNHLLTESVRQNGKVVLGCYGLRTDRSKGATDEKVPYLTRNFLKPEDERVLLNPGLRADRLLLPFPELAQVALGLGHLNWAPEGRERVRSHLPFLVYEDALLPSYALRLALAYLDQEPGQVLVKEEKIQLADRSIPLYKGEMLFGPRRGGTNFPQYSFSDILEAKKTPVAFKDKIVLVGFSDDRGEQLVTPVKSALSRPEITAHAIDSIINNGCVSRPGHTRYFELLAILLMGSLALFLFQKVAEPWRLACFIGLGTLIFLAGMLPMFFLGVWFRTVYLFFCVLGIYVAISFRELIGYQKMARELLEANKTLGLNFQRQGLLDLAFEQFRACPLDRETKDLVYHLGLEAEERGMISDALVYYQYVIQKGPYRDSEQRVSKLKTLERFPDFDSVGARRGAGVLSLSFLKARKKVGRYQILEELGKGTMGQVYKGLDPKINRPLAIKVIRFSDEFDEEMIQEIKKRFFREAEIAGRLSHPGIVTIYDVGEDLDLTYMTMEYLEGEDLASFCTKDNLLPLVRVLDVVAKVADALDYAHQSHVIHRDIKPANIMLLKDGRIKVTDFGIAKAVSSAKTKTGVILGTPNYMSPEQIMGHNIDARTDIFSLGVLFFHLLTGEPPFRGKNLSNLLFQITQGRHPSLRDLNPRIPRACEQILDKALAKNPDDRFETASAMAKYLRLLNSKISQVAEIRQTGKWVGSTG